MAEVFLGLGGNLGDREKFLGEALRRLRVTAGVEVVAVSSAWETKAVGVTAQPDFFNAVARVRTTLTAEALLDACLRIEGELGRVRRERWGPREIDLDVLWYEGVMVDGPRLTLPHPRLCERAFVLAPLAELAPALVVDGVSVGRRAEELLRAGEGGEVRNVGVLRWRETERAPC